MYGDVQKMSFENISQLELQLSKLELLRKDKFKKITNSGKWLFLFFLGGGTLLGWAHYHQLVGVNLLWVGVPLVALYFGIFSCIIAWSYQIRELNYSYQYIIVRSLTKRIKENFGQFRIKKRISLQDIVYSRLFSFVPNTLDNIGVVQKRFSYGILRAEWVNASFRKSIHCIVPIFYLTMTIFRGLWICVELDNSPGEQPLYWIISRNSNRNWRHWLIKCKLFILKHRIILSGQEYREFNDSFFIYSVDEKLNLATKIISSWKSKLLEINKKSPSPVCLILFPNKIIFVIQEESDSGLFNFKPYTSLERMNHNIQKVSRILEILNIF